MGEEGQRGRYRWRRRDCRYTLGSELDLEMYGTGLGGWNVCGSAYILACEIRRVLFNYDKVLIRIVRYPTQGIQYSRPLTGQFWMSPQISERGLKCIKSVLRRDPLELLLYKSRLILQVLAMRIPISIPNPR